MVTKKGPWCPFGVLEKEKGHHEVSMVPVWVFGKGKRSPRRVHGARLFFLKKEMVTMKGPWCPFGFFGKEKGHHEVSMVPVSSFGKGKWSL